MPNRMAVIIMIQACPPPRPACFDSDRAWKDWLIGAHTAKLKIVRRDDRGKWTGNRHAPYKLLDTPHIPYCVDCSAAYRTKMEGQGRCHPSLATAVEDEEPDAGPQACALRMVMA